MKAIRFKVFQESANYRVPTTYDDRYSYDLPPFSTVVGMIHNMCGFTEYHAMDIAVKGGYESKDFDLAHTYHFTPNKADSGRNYQLVVEENGLNKQGVPAKTGIIRQTSNIELLWNINLTIYVMLHDQTETESVMRGIKMPLNFPSLGRWEDIAVISDVSIIDLEETSVSRIRYRGYTPPALNATNFWVNKDYKIKNKSREFNKVSTSIASGIVQFEEEVRVYYDSTNNEYAFLF